MKRVCEMMALVVLLATASACDKLKARSLESALAKELPSDCTSYAGTAAAGATCSSRASAEKAKLVFVAHCEDIQALSLMSVKVEHMGGGKLESWQIESPSTSCKFTSTQH